MNSIRTLVEMDYNNFSFRVLLESNLYLSVILPLTSFLIIVLKRTKPKYVFDYTDFFFILSAIVIFLYTLVSPNIVNGLSYAFKYICIGAPFYFISKFIIINYQIDFNELYLKYFKLCVLASLLTAIVGLLFAYSVDFFEPSLGNGKEYRIERISIPGVHPIPYAQVIGLGVLILISSLFSKGEILRTNSKYNILIIIAALFLMFSVLLSNTRGIILSIGLSSFLFIYLFPRRVISVKNLKILLVIFVIVIITSVYFVDYDIYLERIFNTFNNDASISSRTEILLEAFKISFTKLLGVGTSGFIFTYPHNFFLDYTVFFGAVGWFLSAYFVLLLWVFFKETFKRKNNNSTLILLFCMIIYFFSEALISFTLWMHKGLYASIGLFVAYLYLCKKREKEISTKQDNID
ncbi:O-antigen ligase family protein [Tamlana sp. 62-3]|uniref:O-antigen ligase family protein n=1 Tax=Neotamlana sargassicola TaxID=2883125 RepID=A0A9X1I4F5_9FLAO|nr:O-antigen ligase family protein [Tamlana sargassicola]MCB4807308.1 O-antigen ligase family protein [Tamlana sargassicola]